MHVLNRLKYLLKDDLDLVLVLDPGLWELPDILVQVVSVDIFYDDMHLVVVLDRVHESHNALMVQLGEDLAFFLEGIDALNVFEELLGLILLDGDLLTGGLVGGSLNDAE